MGQVVVTAERTPAASPDQVLGALGDYTGLQRIYDAQLAKLESALGT